MNDRTPADVIVKSDPETVNVTACRSVAVTVPTAVVFSLTVKVEGLVKTGAVVSTTLTVLVAAVAALPDASEALYVMV